jgi:hypothetical protein
LAKADGVGVRGTKADKEARKMLLMLLALLIILIVAGAGFALHVLWWVAIAALIVWLIGFLFRRG